jgi:hypothetical protein
VPELPHFEHEARMEKNTNALTILVGKTEGTDHFRKLSLYGEILKLILKNEE